MRCARAASVTRSQSWAACSGEDLMHLTRRSRREFLRLSSFTLGTLCLSSALQGCSTAPVAAVPTPAPTAVKSVPKLKASYGSAGGAFFPPLMGETHRALSKKRVDVENH